MRHFISRLLIAMLLLQLSACATVKYADDYKNGTDFTGLKTYNWRTISADIGGIDKTILRNLADEQLRARGLVLADTSADLLIDMNVFSRVNKGGNTSIGFGIGLPVGNGGSVGLGTGQTLGRGTQEGVIVLDITQTTSNTLLWRGNADGIPLIIFSLKAEHKLRDIFKTLLQPFPPHVIAK